MIYWHCCDGQGFIHRTANLLQNGLSGLTNQDMRQCLLLWLTSYEFANRLPQTFNYVGRAKRIWTVFGRTICCSYGWTALISAFCHCVHHWLVLLFSFPSIRVWPMLPLTHSLSRYLTGWIGRYFVKDYTCQISGIICAGRWACRSTFAIHFLERGALKYLNKTNDIKTNLWRWFGRTSTRHYSECLGNCFWLLRHCLFAPLVPYITVGIFFSQHYGNFCF